MTKKNKMKPKKIKRNHKKNGHVLVFVRLSNLFGAVDLTAPGLKEVVIFNTQLDPPKETLTFEFQNDQDAEGFISDLKVKYGADSFEYLIGRQE